MKILTVIGARPQFIKAATLSREFKNHPELQEIIVHTGQHFEPQMSDIFFKELQIPEPRYNLAVHSLSHGAMTGRMLEGIEKILLAEKPRLVLVYGDTNSTLAGALAAKKLHIPVAHVEAGLRSFNMKMPEEINRILTDQISDLLFCPTSTAVENLKREGFDRKNCHYLLSGDVMYDSTLFFADRTPSNNTSPYAVCTIHREENANDTDHLKSILEALQVIGEKVKIIFPTHPRTRNILKKMNFDPGPNIDLIEPVSYGEMISLVKNSRIIITDSGGLQKEAYFLEKPCLTLRSETEWTELVTSGTNVLCGTRRERILEAFQLLTTKNLDFSGRYYGNGHSAKKIADETFHFLTKHETSRV